ncbi:MAG: hypothetical protein VZQ83_04225 [Eubacterium sp.]|nr:hypothetical protein [Eubacterium sp.]
MALILSFALLLSVVYPVAAPEKSDAATLKLNKTSMTIRAGKSKVLKMSGTYLTVSWSISSGKSYVKLKNYKRKQVTVVGKKQGKATVKGTIWYSAKKKKSLKCKVTVKPPQWQCPRCGMMNDTNFCSNCGEKKPNPSATPSVTATPPMASGSPGPSMSPTPTPISPEQLSDKHMVMILNKNFYFNVQLYANSAAMTFYERVSKNQISELSMGPDGANEKCCLVTPGINTYISTSYQVEKGELFMYGIDVLKLSANNHTTGAYPTRIGKVIPEHVDMLDQALEMMVDGKTLVQFKQYM